jgi:hypothetical protein
MIDLFRFCLSKVIPNTISSKVPSTAVWVSTMVNEGLWGIGNHRCLSILTASYPSAFFTALSAFSNFAVSKATVSGNAIKREE